jgi:hypothetical protein
MKERMASAGSLLLAEGISRLLLIRLFQEATICWGRGAFRAVLFAVP